MPKKKNLGKRVGIGFIIVGLLITGVYLVGGGTDGGLPGINKDKITCSVEVSNPLAFNVELGEVECARKTTTFCTSLQLFGIISDDASVVFKAGGFSDQSNYNLIETESDTKRLSLCLSEEVTTGKIELFDEDGEKVEEKVVNF